ncbi:MAG: HNH endonuclease [Pseudonocardia sp.]|nr:HNH endonuclease [Pseudonocardia sp.]
MTFIARPLIDRLFGNFTLEPSGCWIYTGHLSSGGYSQIALDNGERQYRHVASFELFIGTVRDGLQLDHTCRRPACFNPRHLDPVTARTNVLRSNAWGGTNARKTTCPRGHTYDGVNNQGRRICRRCSSAAALAHYHRKQQGARA